jgi:putative transposase
MTSGEPSELKRRHLAHLKAFERQPLTFLTVVTAQRDSILANAETHNLLRDLWTQSAALNGWAVGRYVVMPDHVHLFTRPLCDAVSLARWVQTWKSLSSRRITARLNRPSPIWQRDYFDRFLRSAESYSEKWSYVVQNPVRRGLVAQAADWPWQGEICTLQF